MYPESSIVNPFFGIEPQLSVDRRFIFEKKNTNLNSQYVIGEGYALQRPDRVSQPDFITKYWRLCQRNLEILNRNHDLSSPIPKRLLERLENLKILLEKFWKCHHDGTETDLQTKDCMMEQMQLIIENHVAGVNDDLSKIKIQEFGTSSCANGSSQHLFLEFGFATATMGDEESRTIERQPDLLLKGQEPLSSHSKRIPSKTELRIIPQSFKSSRFS